ncbi:NAD kinase [Ketogulonicigenium vulgare]|uniref:NAD kinase n=1 Tax=Ketogulonicigenium vulgare TaxID=92945 RepID=UPI0023593C73|nr:NAD kinase [Ketogulonicigenium vulgare]
MSQPLLHFAASRAPLAQEALAELTALYGQAPLDQAEAIVALGGDGFMLSTLHAPRPDGLPVYGMNRGTVGFLMNDYRPDDLHARIRAAEVEVINPLHMRATDTNGTVREALAINEVSLLRTGAQAAKLRVFVDGRLRMPELVCDGALVSTPAGSTAYNYSAMGPILPIGSEVLALTAIAPYRPRRWRGAVLPRAAVIRIEVNDPAMRPVMANADSQPFADIAVVEVRSEPAVSHRILFDPGHGLEERLISEQFA